MKANKKEILILSLIKDDLINARLVRTLNDIGLNADDYLLRLSETIFKLIGIKDTVEKEDIYDYYMALTHRAKYIDISKGHNALDQLVEEIYAYLLHKRG